MVGPGPELLENPAGQAGGGVGEAVRQCLGVLALDLLVGAAVGEELAHLGQVDALGLGELTVAGKPDRHVEVDAGEVFGVDETQPGGDEAAPVAPLGQVAVEPEPGHQLGPGLGHRLDVPAGAGRGPGEPEAGQRGDDDVKRVGSIAPVGDRIAQRLDHVEELGDRPGPAVGQQQRHRVGLGGTGDDHVDRRAADRRAVLRPGVEAGLGRAPVVGVAPSATECLERRHVGAVVPADVRELVGPAGVPQAQAQIVQELVRDGDRCRLKPVGHRMVGRWALDRRITDPLVGRWCAIAAFGSSHRFPLGWPPSR